MARTHTGAPANGVILVSVPKAGTHMLAAVVEAFGYSVKGVAGDRPTKDEKISFGYWIQQLGLLPELCNSDGYWWLERLSKPASWPRKPAPWKEKQCLVLHELFLDRIDGGIFRHWESTGEPKIIFNYRDPRACLTSYVHFLRDGERMEPTPTQLAYRAILGQFDFHEALMYAICDPNFPGKRHFKQMRWMFDHPRVLNTRYEDLVGPKGRGRSPREALARIGAHLNSDAGLEMEPWSDKSPTFRTGHKNSWRRCWAPEHHAAYLRLHWGVLRGYGYE